jgi:hypothetical protein
VRGTLLPRHIDNFVVFGGEQSQPRSDTRVVGWRDVHTIFR